MIKVLKFYADWCAPCKVLKTTLNGFNECEIQDVNIEKESELTAKYNVKQLPTLVAVDAEGNELWRKTGVTTTPALTLVVRNLKEGN